MANMNNKNKIYEVQIKSKALIQEGKKSLITYFKGGTHEQIVANARALYPQYTKIEDKPNIDITPISLREYKKRLSGDIVVHKGLLIKGEAHII